LLSERAAVAVRADVSRWEFFELRAAPFNLPFVRERSAASLKPASKIILCSACSPPRMSLFLRRVSFLNTVDEQMHFDLVVDYSQANIPHQLTPPNVEALPFMVITARRNSLDVKLAKHPAPVEAAAGRCREKLVAKSAAYQDHFQNHEAASPPLYYSIAARGGGSANCSASTATPALLAAVLNVPLIVALVWLAGGRKNFSGKHFHPHRRAALIAFLRRRRFMLSTTTFFRRSPSARRLCCCFILGGGNSIRWLAIATGLRWRRRS